MTIGLGDQPGWLQMTSEPGEAVMGRILKTSTIGVSGTLKLGLPVGGLVS
jgi:hypothetical protein